MPLKEKLSGPKRFPNKRDFISIAILFLTFPFTLPAQEPRATSKTGLGDSDLTSAEYDRNENSSGVDHGTMTPSQPIQATNNSDNDRVHAWMRRVDEVRASQPH